MKNIYVNGAVKNYMNEDHCSCKRNFCNCEKKAWKDYSGLYGIRTLDLCDTGVVLYQLSWQANWDDLHSHNSSLRSSHMCFSYVHNFIIIFSRVYNEPIQRSAPTWLFTLIGSCIFNCDNLLSYNSSLRSSHICFWYIYNLITLSRVFFLKRKLSFAKKTVFHRVNTSQLLFEFSN